MNQILSTKDNNTNNNGNQKNKKNAKTKPFKIQLMICLITIVTSLSFYSYHLYDLNKHENISKKLVDSFNIATLYSNSTDYNSIRTTVENNENDYSLYVIGLIEISSIHVNYPILSNVNEDLLKIAPCRFYGPMPNEVGNLCIAGHNYKNYKFFSRLNELKLDDMISIYDLNGNKVNYKIYNKYEVNANELNCTSQETNGTKEVTLITCNSVNNTKRIVIKARETG